MTTESLAHSRQKIGDLNCVVVDTPGCEENIRAVVVLCHGFGAPGEDLVPCAQELYRFDEQALRHVRFVFPAAPLELDTGGMYESRAWWPIDMLKLQMLMEGGEIRDLRGERPELLDSRSFELRQLLESLIAETGLTIQHFVLGGFSQGSMLATDVALALKENPGGLIVWSGSLLGEDRWLEYAKRKSGLKVVQSHGRLDPILPFSGAELLKEMLIAHGNEVDFIAFDGPHTIPGGGIERAAELIASVATESASRND